MQDNSYLGRCTICGYGGVFEKNAASFREGYQCDSCKASLRYQGQASAILSVFSNSQSAALQDLVGEERLRSLSIYEPGVAGPFRKLLSDFPHYVNSFYWDDVALGAERDGTQCQSLEDLTFENDEFDLIISSDVMGNVRKPWAAFSEIFRVLKRGGCYIFSIPVHLPMPALTKYRVETSTDKDVHVEEPRYTGDGQGGRSLVYTEFGADILSNLSMLGYELTCHAMANEHPEVKKLVTFIAKKP